MKNIFFLFIAFISMQLVAQDYSFTIGDTSYKLVTTQRDWASASADAVQQGGYLVEINDSAEQDAIWQAIQDSGISMTYTSVGDGGGIAYVWIGATDKAGEGTWLWDGDNDNNGENFWNGQGAWGSGNGSAVNGAYYNWGGTNTGTPNEPDDYGSNQDAGAIGLEPWPAAGMGNIAGEWNDIAITNSLYYIIEFDANAIDENQSIPALRIAQNGKEIRLQTTELLTNIEVFDLSGKQIYNFDKIQSRNFSFVLPTAGLFIIQAEFDNQIVRTDKVLV